MIEIKLTKKTNGKEIIEEMKNIYGSIERLEKIVNRNPKDAKAYYDLDDWKYYKDHLNEEIVETDVLLRDSFQFDKIELNLLDVIKNKKPKNLSELSKLANKSITNILPKINNLKKEGLIELKKGNKNSKVPIAIYDKIEIGV
jgi:predicted transcriptional regulator